jgi:diguanylate cyclase (GGDEF)-like protein
MSEQSNPGVRRVLVIDDNEAIHEDLKKTLGIGLTSSGLDELEAELFGGGGGEALNHIEYDIDSAFQGLDGVARVKAAMEEERPYLLAFVDMRMPPGIDGLDTIELLWKEDPDLQVVVCTAFSDYSWDDMVKRLGVTDQMLIVKKPFDQAEICQAAAAMSEKGILTQQAKLKLEDLEQLVERRTLELRKSNEQLEVEIAERRAAEEKLRHDAFHDTLTNLPNRALLMQRLDRSIERGRRNQGYMFAVLFLDIDNFKIINDSLGHNLGDEVLISVADRLVSCVRSMDTVVRQDEDTTARLGGDEFVILLEGIKDPGDTILVADRIQEVLNQPINLGGNELAVSSSIGIAVSSGEYASSEDILRDADTAMYRAKAGGKARYAIFNKEMHQAAIVRLQLETDLRTAIDQQQFHLEYQPIVKLDTGTVCGFEALLRWERPNHGLVGPAEFIPVAEERGLIVPIGTWVLEQACRQMRTWLDKVPDDTPLTMSVNLSRRQIAEPGLVEDVQRILEMTQLDGSRLNLEVTESGIMENEADIAQVLSELRDLGVHLHMDDFGTGYSSLSCLHNYPLEVLKVDRAFLDTMGGNRDYAAVIHAIMSLAHNLNMKVTAEGVETPDQVALLLSLECDYAQGHYYARPMSTSAAEMLLTSEEPWLKKSA